MLSKKQRRFLIIWYSVASFAFLCNIAPIEGRVYDGDFYINLFANRSSNEYGFWPFSSQFLNEQFEYTGEFEGLGWGEDEGFNGIFNGFGYLELLVYGVVGIATIKLPKYWN